MRHMWQNSVDSMGILLTRDEALSMSKVLYTLYKFKLSHMKGLILDLTIKYVDSLDMYILTRTLD